jgi:cytochrome P450
MVTQPLPPGPKAPSAWQILRYSLSPLPFLEECQRRFGDAFTTRMAGYGKLVMLASPEAVQDVFHGDAKALHSGEGNEFLSLTVGTSSVLVLDEDAHARQRRVLLPPLKGERMRSFVAAMQEATCEAIQAWPIGQPIRMVEPMQQITLRVILQAVLGLAPGLQRDDLENKIRRILAMARGRFGLILVKLVPLRLVKNSRWLPFFRQLRDLDQVLFEIIAKRRAQAPPERGDNVLADLLNATYEDGQPVSDQEIRDAVITLLIAGHETTALALAWALEQIVPREDVVAAITQELRTVTNGGPLRADHLVQLNYLDAAIRESLRVRTILPFVVRVTKRHFVAGGHEYPPGIMLCPCNHLVHRRPELYPDPEVFRPERFLERKFSGNQWFPFGGGNRTCLGMAFALHEMKVVLATLFGQAKLIRPSNSDSRPVRSGITLAPNDGAKMIVAAK